MLPNTLHIMRPMLQPRLMLLHSTVKEKMHLQENTLFDHDLRVNVTRNVATCPLYHVTYAPTEFEVTTSKGLGGDAFTRKLNIWPLTLTLGSMMPPITFLLKRIYGLEEIVRKIPRRLFNARQPLTSEWKKRSISKFLFGMTYPIKFLLMRTYGLEKDVVWRISTWLFSGWPSFISEWND